MCKWITALLCIWQLIRFTAPSLVFKSTNIECLPNPKYVANATCYLKAVDWNQAVAQMDCDLIVPLTNVSVQLAVFKRNYNNRYHPFLVNVTVNMCDIIARRTFLPYGIMLWKTVKKHTNANHSCPFMGHMQARNMYIDADLVPNIPYGFYQFSINIIENVAGRFSESFGIVKYYFQVMDKVTVRHKGHAPQ